MKLNFIVKSIIVLLVIILAVIVLINQIETIERFFQRNFGETIQLNYPKDISKISISGTDFPEEITIEKTEDIDTLITMFNSLELVEFDTKIRKFDYSKPYIKIYTKIEGTETKGHYEYSIDQIYGSNIVLSEHYITVFPTNYENIYYTYYVKNPILSFKYSSNEIIQHIKTLVEESKS